jgi:antitoxin MazE
MKSYIVRMGKSKVVRIPNSLLEQAGIRGEVEVTGENGSLVIRPIRRPREGWAAVFKEMAARGDDAMLDDVASTLSHWDEDEWKWR